MGKYFSIFFESGDMKTALADFRDIGKFTARIIADPRTLNRYVFIAGEELTQKEIIAIAERVAGRKISVVHWTEADLAKHAEQSEAVLAKAGAEYMRSMWLLGENTTERAKTAEYGSALDARELYPDVPVRSLEEYAREHYADLK
jgi:uncharacterized protein YbjT (DUF2867 family)